MNNKMLFSITIVAILHCFFSSNNMAFAKEPPALETQTILKYINEELFDRDLHDALDANYQVVHVDPVKKFTVEELPRPIMKWLSAIRGKGGGYRFIDESKGPSATDTESSEIAALIFQIITELWNAIKEIILYSPAKNYKAEIYYKSPTDLSVTKIIFKRLPPQ
jgi:hypothetical protein